MLINRQISRRLAEHLTPGINQAFVKRNKIGIERRGGRVCAAVRTQTLPEKCEMNKYRYLSVSGKVIH